MTSEAPERIWLQLEEEYWCVSKLNGDDAEYIRADLHHQALEAAREEGRRQGLKDAAKAARNCFLIIAPESVSQRVGAESVRNTIANTIETLIDAPADRVAEAAIPHTPTIAQLQSVCYSMRHDYGLMTREEQETLEFHAAEAWKAVAGALAQKEGE